MHWSYRCEHPVWLFTWCQVLNSGPCVYATITLHWVISPAPISSHFWFLNCPHLQPQTCFLSVVLPRHRFKICNLLCRVSFSYYFQSSIFLKQVSICPPSLPPSLPSSLAPSLSKQLSLLSYNSCAMWFIFFNAYSSMVHKLCDRHHNPLKTFSLFQKETPAIHLPPTPTSPAPGSS